MTSRAPRRDVVVIGGSAGAVEALGELLGDLPRDLPAIIAAVVHLSASLSSRLPEVLRRRSRLPVIAAENGQVLQPGRVYVGVPDYHFVMTPSGLALTRGARQNFVRPAVDALFRSAADVYRDRVVGVLLSGVGRDGTLGLIAVKSAGGVALVQDPETAAYKPMLVSAIANDSVDGVMSIAQISMALLSLATGGPIPGATTPVPHD